VILRMIKESGAKMHEADIYDPVREYLESLGYQVQAEVKGCDLTAIKGDELVIVELKTSFNLKLLIQAAKRQRAADSVYVAVPFPKGGTRTAGWRDMCMLLRRLELGLITVRKGKPEDRVVVHFHPDVFDRWKSMRANRRVRHHIINETVDRSGRYNTGGTNRVKLVTAYREQAVHIACCLMKHGCMSPSQLMKAGTCAKTPNILRDNHYGWFTRVKRGLYALNDNDSAKAFMEEYPELARHYMELAEASSAHLTGSDYPGENLAGR
jgi:hypothetical protein